MNEALKPLPWQEPLWVQVTAQVLQGRLAHALLFTGARGVGKRHFARALAMFLLCEARSGYACGSCRSCTQFQAGNHPNFHVLRRRVDDKTGKEKRDIAIEQVRELSETLALAAHYGQSRVALIDPADALNASGVNALLKTIEEPPPASHLILISERPQALAATLRSRCQKLRFAAPSDEQARAWLGQGRAADEALRWSLGAPLRAREMIETGLVERARNWAEEMTAIAAGRREPLSLAAQFAKKDDAAEFLDWLQVWLTAQLRERLRRGETGAAVESVLQEAVAARRGLGGNAAPQLLLESILVLWWHLHRRAAAA